MGKYSAKHTKRLREGLKSSSLSFQDVMDLLHKKANPNQLDLAIKYDDADMFGLFLKFGANPNRAYGHILNARKIIELCIHGDKIECLKVLVKHPNLSLTKEQPPSVVISGYADGWKYKYDEYAYSYKKFEATKIIARELKIRRFKNSMTPLLQNRGARKKPIFKV